ncbi:MAG: hypothetical protein KF832_28065 [Caldilineaceae bacterium]|nr:hypothetical protein [Caldilineaceae bacterium]
MQCNTKGGPAIQPPPAPADQYEAAFWQNWRARLRIVRQKPWLITAWLQQNRTLLNRFNRLYDHLCRQPRPIRRRLQRQLGSSLAGVALALALANSPAQALPPAPANAQINGTSCDLIDAIVAANTDTATGACNAGNAGADTITLISDVTLSAVNTNVSGNTTGLPWITTEITIEGGGHTISRDASAPTFRLLAVEASGNLTLHQVTLSGGNTASGGGLMNYGTVTVSNSTLSGNSASTGGGGIGNLGTMTVDNSTLSDNSAGNSGAALFNQGTLTVNNSTFSGNSADQGGGALFNMSTATVSNSTLSGNSADQGGGALFNMGTLTVSNSTLSGNSATNNGGGLFNYGTVTLERSLISGNTAASGQEVFNYLGCLSAASANTSACQASTSAIYTTSTNLFGHSGLTNAQAFYNFTPDASNITATSDGTTPTALANILKTTLTTNGGGTGTHALVPGSPAIDAAGDSGLSSDQRGVTRPQGTADDIGAFEALPINVSFNGSNCNLNDAIAAANQDQSYGDCNPGVAGADTITLLGDITLLAQTNQLSNYNSLTPISSTITIEGDGFTLARDEAATDPFGLLVVVETGDLTLNNITLTGAYSKYGALANIGQLTVNNSTITGNQGAALGGGLFNAGLATVNNSSITDNTLLVDPSIPFLGGGGIANWLGTLTVNNSNISGNSSTGIAGGIANTKYGTLLVNESTLSGNTGGSAGGAIFSFVGTSTSVTSSTISDNTAAGYGGGIGGYTTPLLVTNSTISNNEAEVGGGIILMNNSALTMKNSTLTGNTGTSSGGGLATDNTMQLTGNLIAGNNSAAGAEIFDSSGSPTLMQRAFGKSATSLTPKLLTQVANSPFFRRVQALIEARKAAQSQEASVQSAGVAPTPTSPNLFGHSGLTSAEAFEGFIPGGADLVATSDGTIPTPLEGILSTTLADNGGPTLTHALSHGSPAIDAAGDSSLATDQRGVSRPLGIADDIGAVEMTISQLNTGSVAQQTLNTVYDADTEECGTPTHTLTPTLINNESESYHSLYFVVRQLEYTSPQEVSGTPVFPTLCNADSGQSGGVGSKITVNADNLSGGTLDPTETFVQQFIVSLPIRTRYRIFVDLYGQTVNAASSTNATRLIGTLSWEFDEAGNVVGRDMRLFIPLVKN